jgi:ubiquinone/menaquinone biosynthesis C-methylase UbiE
MSGAGAFGRLVSRQAAHPRGLLGRVIGRIWVRETAAVNDAVIAVLDPKPEETVVEIGHGPGRTVQRVLAAGADAIGVEVSDAMIRLAGRRNRRAIADGRLRLHQGDGAHLPLGGESVDAVIAVHTIYFWTNPQSTLVECARVLRPGGRLVLASRDGALPLPRRLDPAIYTVPTLDDLDAWITNAGLIITGVQTLDAVLIVTASDPPKETTQ